MVRLKEVGSYSLRDAFEVVKATSKSGGRGVTSGLVVLSASQRAAHEKVLQSELDKVNSRLSAGGRQFGPAVVFKRDLLEALLAHSDVRFHANHVASALMLANGVSGDDLYHPIKAAIGLQGKKRIFSGSAIRFTGVWKNDLLNRLHSNLRERGAFVSGAVLVSELGADPHRFASAVTLLHLGGLVHKLPIDSSTQGSFVWGSSELKPPVPTWNWSYRVLSRLVSSGEPLNLVKLAASFERGVHYSEGSTLPQINRGIRVALANLQSAGLISHLKSSRGVVYSPTGVASELIRATEQTGVLHPVLGLALTGEFVPNRSPVLPAREDAILKEVKFKLAHGVAPRKSVTVLASKFGLNPRTAAEYAGGGKSSFYNLGRARISALASRWHAFGLTREAKYLEEQAKARE